VTIPIFTFQQLPIGEATESKWRDIHGFGRAIENQLDQTRARGGGGLEARAAQAAGEIETVGTRRAVDGALVGGDTVTSHVDGVQAALFDLRNALNHRINEFLNERGRGRLVFGIGRFTAQAFVFARSQDQRTALGAEITVDGIVDHRGDLAKRRWALEERHIVSPRLKRDIDIGEFCDMLRPRSGRADNCGRRKFTLSGADAFYGSARRVDGCHFAILNQRRAVPFGGFDERVGCEGRIGVTRIGFVRGEVKLVSEKIRDECAISSCKIQLEGCSLYRGHGVDIRL
jgi:hypothetical protein